MLTPPSGSTPKVSVTTRQLITEFHSVVLELTDAGYPKEQAIQAVERRGSDVQACIDYMLTLEGVDEKPVKEGFTPHTKLVV